MESVLHQQAPKSVRIRMYMHFLYVLLFSICMQILMLFISRFVENFFDWNDGSSSNGLSGLAYCLFFGLVFMPTTQTFLHKLKIVLTDSHLNISFFIGSPKIIPIKNITRVTLHRPTHFFVRFFLKSTNATLYEVHFSNPATKKLDEVVTIIPEFTDSPSTLTQWLEQHNIQVVR